MDDAMRLVRRVETHLSSSELAAGFMSGILSQNKLESYLKEGAYDTDTHYFM